VANLASGIAAVPPKGEFSLLEILHLQMEEYNISSPVATHRNLSIHPKIHVPVERRVVVPDLEPSR
jgi:hypothetical protein